MLVYKKIIFLSVHFLISYTIYSYKRLLVMKGYIYKIINVKNGHFYIGSTVEIDKRRDKHFKDLKNGRHHSLHLQRAYNIYG